MAGRGVLREILTAAVRHLHGFVRDAHLSEPEFHQACGWIARVGQMTSRPKASTRTRIRRSRT